MGFMKFHIRSDRIFYSIDDKIFNIQMIGTNIIMSVSYIVNPKTVRLVLDKWAKESTSSVKKLKIPDKYIPYLRGERNYNFTSLQPIDKALIFYTIINRL